MSVAMTNCGGAGWVSDKRGYRYDPLDPSTQKPWPTMPTIFADLAQRAAAETGFEDFAPDACLINRYDPGARLTLHQDKNERNFDAPIVSVSLGLPAKFLFGGMKRTIEAEKGPSGVIHEKLGTICGECGPRPVKYIDGQVVTSFFRNRLQMRGSSYIPMPGMRSCLLIKDVYGKRGHITAYQPLRKRFAYLQRTKREVSAPLQSAEIIRLDSTLDDAESLHGLGDPLKARDIGAQHVVAWHSVFLRGFRTAIVNVSHDIGEARFGPLERPTVTRCILLHFERRGCDAARVRRFAGAK